MSGSSRRGGLVWATLVLAVIGAVLLVPSPVRPYDLDSAEPGGYRGLRLLLEETGTTVERVDAADIDGAAAGRFDVVYVPVADSASDELVRRWRRYVAAGGRLVIGTPSTALGVDPSGDPEQTVPVSTEPVSIGRSRPGVCTIAALSDGRAVEVPAAGGLLAVRNLESCYGDENEALVVRRAGGDALGRGEIFAVAGPDFFTNIIMGAPEIDQTSVDPVPDNAVVAQRLLGHGVDPGGTRLAVVTSGVASSPLDGTRSLSDFIPSAVVLGLWQLAVAFAWYARARGRRHGRVVTEPVPVAIAGSAFTEAVGDLFERQGSTERAAEVLRAAQCRDLARRLGVPAAISRPDLAAVLADRTGRDAATITALLTDSVETERSLVDLSRELDSLRQEALNV